MKEPSYRYLLQDLYIAFYNLKFLTASLQDQIENEQLMFEFVTSDNLSRHIINSQCFHTIPYVRIPALGGSTTATIRDFVAL
ncbi:hypothetical protein V1478_017369 [Vespula squamosa]|uniref:Uncharacterized protein n=1 Tax=Vespula squamosa TaxID=30214 RepID=A0ABD1ZXS9_VESSQ